MLRHFLSSKDLICEGKLKDTFFSRNRIFSFKYTVLFIVNLARRSLQFEINDFTVMNKINSATKQAFSKARRKLNPVVFKRLNGKFVSEFYTDNELKTFKGFRVLAIDGTTIQLPSSEELISYYGCSSNKFGPTLPMARASTMFDVLNKVTIDSIISQYKSSERNQALELLDSLLMINKETNFSKTKIKDLLIFDRGYPSAKLIFELKKNNQDFLMRCSSSFISAVNNALENNKNDQIISVKIECLSGALKRALYKILTKVDLNQKIELRLLTFDLSSGEKEILLTTLLDKKYTPMDLFGLYQARWDIEENYKFIKTIASVENFSGKSKLTVEQDFYATIFTCNLAMMLMQEAQDELNDERKDKKFKHKYNINKNIGLGILKDKLIEVLASNKDLNEFCNQVKLQMKKSLVSVRKNRNFSRKSKSPNRNHAINRRSCM